MGTGSSYEPRLSTPAKLALQDLDDDLARLVAGQIVFLCESPAHRSDGPSVTPPEWPAHQAYRFSLIHRGVQHYFRVLFKYFEDEQHLWIAAITHQELSGFYPPPE